MNNQEGQEREKDKKTTVNSQNEDEQLPPISFDDFRNVSSANETSTISQATECFNQENGQHESNSPNVLDFQVCDEQVQNQNRQQHQQPISDNSEQGHGENNFAEPFLPTQAFQDVKAISSKQFNSQQVWSNQISSKEEVARSNIPIAQESRGKIDQTKKLKHFNFKEQEIKQNEKERQVKKQNGLEEQIIKYHEMQEILQRKKVSRQNGQSKIDENKAENQERKEEEDQNKSKVQTKENIQKNNLDMPFKPSKQGFSWQFSNHLNNQNNPLNNQPIPSVKQQEYAPQSPQKNNMDLLQNENVISKITTNSQSQDSKSTHQIPVHNKGNGLYYDEKEEDKQGIDLIKPSEDIPLIGNQNKEQAAQFKNNNIPEPTHYPSHGDDITLFYCQTCGQFGVCKLCQNHQNHLLVDLNNDSGFFQQKVATYMERLEEKQQLLEYKAQIEYQEIQVEKQEALNIFQNAIQKLQDSLVAYETKVSSFIEENYTEFPQRTDKLTKLFNSIETEKKFFMKTIEEAQQGQSKNELNINISSDQDQQSLCDSQVQQTCIALYAQNRDRIEQSLKDPSAENELQNIIRENDGIFQFIKPLQIATDLLLDKCKDDDSLTNNTNKLNLKNASSRSQHTFISQEGKRKSNKQENSLIRGEKINNFDEIQQKIAEKTSYSNDQNHWSEKYLNNIIAKQVIINNGLQRQDFQSQESYPNYSSFSDQKNKGLISTKTKDLSNLFQTELSSQNNNKVLECSPTLAEVVNNNNNTAHHEGFNPQISKTSSKPTISALDQFKLNKQLLNIEQILKDRNNYHFTDSFQQLNGSSQMNSSPNSHRSFQPPQSLSVTPSQNSHPTSFSDKKSLRSHSRRISLQNPDIGKNNNPEPINFWRNPQPKHSNDYDRSTNLRLLDISSSKAFSKGIQGNKFSLVNKTLNLSEIGTIRGGLKVGTNYPSQNSKDNQFNRGYPMREQPFALKKEQLSYCTKMISNLFKQKDLYNQGKQQFFD